MVKLFLLPVCRIIIFLTPLGKDSNSEDGWNPHFVCCDEYHAHKDNLMLNIMESGTMARQQPLIIIITTAGFNKNSACYQEEHTLTMTILELTSNPDNKEIIPENYFGIIYTLDEEDDWTDKKVWEKANPNLGISAKIDVIENRVTEALLSPRKQNDVKTKNLNIWTQSESRWILDTVWDKCCTKFNETELIRRRCFGGLDLSTSIDITAFVLCFPPKEKNELYKFLYRFFMPQENILDRERKDKVPYRYWVDQGYIIPTPGNAVDYDFIENQIHADAKTYKLIETAYDPWKADEMQQRLSKDDFIMISIFQKYSGMASVPTVIIRTLKNGGKERAFNHPQVGKSGNIYRDNKYT